MRGFEKLSIADIERRNLKISEPKQSKYRNTRVVVDGEKFDSKREANYWHELKLREKVGEIRGLQRQVKFPLYCPEAYGDAAPTWHQVCEYIADFTYRTGDGPGVLHVVDAKGARTAIYRLKARWLELQDGIIIEEV